jgi:hypothetical protein
MSTASWSELADASAAGDAIEEIDGALARMDVGTNGACESCGAPIALERLEAVPHARLCVGCPLPAVELPALKPRRHRFGASERVVPAPSVCSPHKSVADPHAEAHSARPS